MPHLLKKTRAKKTTLKLARRAPFLLLEVMIAFGILSLAAIPLIYPHLLILKEERALIKELNIDLAAKNMIMDLFVDLYENHFPLSVIEERKPWEISKEKLLSQGISETDVERAYCTFSEKHKPKNLETPNALYEVDGLLHIQYAAKETFHKEEATYPFTFLIERQIGKNEETKK